MNREEMLSKLHSIRVASQPTVITYDMGLQYEYVTHVGHGEGFGNMGDWPAYRLEDLTEEKINIIKTKIQAKILTVADLGGTDLRLFYDYVFNVWRPDSCIPDICVFFENLLSVSLKPNGQLYIMCDACQWEPEAYFYSTYEELEEAFIDYYASDVEPWEDLEDDELEEWLHRIEDGLDTIPFVILRDEVDDE